MEYEIKYKGLIDRATKVKIQESLNRQMIQDNFDLDWVRGEEPYGAMIFIDAKPTSPEELAELEAERLEQEAMSKAEDLIDAISNLNQAKTFLKRLVRRLLKNGALP